MSPVREPVILLGSPRSGTTLLFNAVARSPALWSLGVESHRLFEGPFHPEKRGWSSNALAASDLDDAIRERFLRTYRKRAKPGIIWQMKQARRSKAPGRPSALAFAAARVAYKVRRLFPSEPIRLIEKTPRNVFRVPFLNALFPDARFVVVRRDGRAVVSSLLEGWLAPGRFEFYDVPEPLRISGYSGKKWCFLLPPGWREVLGRPVEEVCAWQWNACMEAVHRDVAPYRAEGRVHDVAYESLVADPAGTLRGVCEFLRIPADDGVVPADGSLPVSASLSPPAPDKWRKMNGAAVERILPIIAPTQARLGYPVDLS